MTKLNQLVTIKEAAKLVHRTPKTVYQWTYRKTNPLPTRIADDGTIRVLTAHVFEAEERARPGRPTRRSQGA